MAIVQSDKATKSDREFDVLGNIKWIEAESIFQRATISAKLSESNSESNNLRSSDSGASAPGDELCVSL